MKNLLLQPAVLTELAKNSNTEFQQALPKFSETITELNQKCLKLDSKLELITDELLKAKESAQKNLWYQKIKRVEEEKERYKKQMESLQMKQKIFQSQELDPKSIEKAIELLFENFEALDGKVKHLMVLNIIDQVKIEKDCIVIAVKNPTRKSTVNQGMQLFYQDEEWLLRPLQELGLKIAALIMIKA